MVATQKRFPEGVSEDVEQCVRGVFNQVNALMKTMCD